MTMSFDEFRASLVSPGHLAALGLPLTDVEAQQVAADPASAQNWYGYWLSLAAAPPAPAAGTRSDAPPPYDPTVAAPAPAYAGHENVTAPYPAHENVTAPYPGYDAASGAAAAYPGAHPPVDGAPAAKRRVGLWVTLSIVGALLLISAIVIVFALTTARHWTKVDVPEQPETFHSEQYETGRYDVTMDTVNPCYVEQDWTDCTNLMVATYNAACVGVELTETATTLCADYSGAIEQMKAQDGDGYYVATLGTYGSLQRTAETATRQVSNEDYKPAVTHEAVCYLEFIGECE